MTLPYKSAIKAKILFGKLKNEYESSERLYLQKYIFERAKLLQYHVRCLEDVQCFNESALLKPAVNEIKNEEVQLSNLAEGLNRPFLLFMIGMGKFGKSTLLNALLGSRLAEMDALPKTWKIDLFEGSYNSDLAEIRLNTGEVLRLSTNEAKSYLKMEEEKRIDSEFRAYEELEKQIVGLNTVEEKEELKKAIQKHILYKSPVTEVRWHVPRNNFLKDFILVDTPGMMQDMLGEVKISLNEYYHKADGVIWLLDASKINAQKARELIDDLNIALAEVGGRTDNIIAVLNRIDKVRNIGGIEAVDSVIKEAKKIFGDIFKDIIPISAKEALQGIENNDQVMIAQSGFNQLLETINKRFLKKSQKIQVESKKQGLNAILLDIRKNLIEYEERLLKDEEKRKKLLIEFETDIATRKSEMNMELDTLFNSFERDVNSNIISKTEFLFDIESNSKREDYIRDNIYQIDKLTKKLEAIQNKLNKSVKESLDYHKKRSLFKEFENLALDKLPSIVQTNFNLLIPTINSKNFKTDGISFVSGAGISIAGAMLLGPIGFLIGGIASALGLTKWIAVQLKSSEIQYQLRSNMEEVIRRYKIDIQSDIDKLFDNVEKDVTEVREQSFSNLHGSSKFFNFIYENLNSIKKEVSLTYSIPSVKNMILRRVI